jgi:pimeloyl-ACP methyl ester carboxylesterase
MTLGEACARVARESPLVPFAEAGGGGYRVVGSGASLLVVLPGIVGSADALAGLGYELAATHRTCLVHYPSVPSLDALLTSLDAMCAREGGGVVSVYGGSFGALVAQAWLSRRPDAFTALVLSGAGPPDAARAAKNARLLPWMARLPMPAWRTLLRLAVRLSIAKTPERDVWRAFYGAAIEALRWPDLESRYTVSIGVDQSRPALDAAVAGWPGRVLVLEGARDAVASARHRAALRAVFPAARFHAFADAGHGLALEQPEAWLRVVSDFLRER